uniref:Two pore potassium channel protein sup-9 n=1 Tax=Ascaris lumbricoides TaxID=6252 RepID=A0A0M3ID13_ASCLU
MDKKSIRAVLLIISTFTYLLFGAAIFEKLESPDDMERRQEIRMISKKMQQKYNFTKKDYELLQTVVIKSIPHKGGYQWKFAGAFYFATVVITTVGYGHSTPDTTSGKLFCMIFALAGIPLGLVMFQSIGERVNTFIAFSLKKLRALLLSKGFNITSQITPTHLLFVSLSIGMLVVLIGTYVFHRAERWTFLEAYYYCFISMTTIGFGDYVPLQTDGVLQKNPGYVVFTLLFLLFGLAFFSASINLLVLGFMAPNADVITAASREPPRAIVFETFDESRPTSLTSHDLHRQAKISNANSVLDSTTHPTRKTSKNGSYHNRIQCSVEDLYGSGDVYDTESTHSSRLFNR